MSQIIITIIFFTKSLYLFRKYIFDITGKYITYLIRREYKAKQNNQPPKKKHEKRNKKRNLANWQKIHTKSKESKDKLIISENINKKFDSKILVINNINNSNSNSNLFLNLNNKKHNYETKNLIIDKKKQNNLNENNNENKKLNKSIKNYLATELDDMVFEDAIEKDKRKFCVIFCDKLKKNITFLDIFFNKEPFRPIPIKIILILIHIELYLFLNAIFFNEEFISEIFHITEEEEKNFFNFIFRSLDRVSYTIFISFGINNIIDCIFIEEKKIKGIFKREKSKFILKNKVYRILKNATNRLILFIIFSFIITFFILYYISCFNNIYPHMIYEWINSSLLIIIVIQVFWVSISFLIVFLDI